MAHADRNDSKNQLRRRRKKHTEMLILLEIWNKNLITIWDLMTFMFEF